MKKGQRLSRQMLLLTGAVLVLYGMAKLGPVREKGEEFFEGSGGQLLLQAQRTYLTGMSYVSEGEHFSLDQWVAESVMRLIPLGTYVEGKEPVDTEVEDSETYQMILAKQAEDENEVDEDGNLVGEEKETAAASVPSEKISMEKLGNYEYLLSNFYTVDSTTMTSAKELNAEKLMKKDMAIDTSGKGPKVLIYHTHSQEAFADSRKGKESDTIVGVGTYLTELLNEKGIETMHHKGVYDLIDGELDRSKAYQLAEEKVQKILKENPSIEVVIDLHRDGVNKDTHLVTEVNGKKTAQIMFFNGLSRTKKNGNIDYLKNPYIEDNLAFSLQMQLKATELYPGFTRHIYLKGYRYNMHLMPKTLLVEAGAQTNTVAEMKNAMELLAETLDHVLTP